MVLIPDPYCLALSKIKATGFTTYDPLLSDSLAIAYPDGHPSEEYEVGGRKFETVIRPCEDTTLRQCIVLGWISIKLGYPWRCEWVETRHVLVIDLDEGRDRHPWIILAHKWPNDTDLDFDLVKYSDVHAEWNPKRGKDDVRGIFPGDVTRTTIAKLVHLGGAPANETRPFLKQLGPDLQIDLFRQGGDRPCVWSKYHPDLVHVMQWYRDEKSPEEVCYARNGEEYMRYNEESGTYRYPNLASIPTDGQQGLFGEIASIPGCLAARLEALNVQGIVPRAYQGHTSEGF